MAALRSACVDPTIEPAAHGSGVCGAQEVQAQLDTLPAVPDTVPAVAEPEPEAAEAEPAPQPAYASPASTFSFSVTVPVIWPS